MSNDDTKVCPYCAEDIKAAAIRCRYCHSDLTHPVVSAADALAELDRVRTETFSELFGDEGDQTVLTLSGIAIQPDPTTVQVSGTLSNLSGLMGSAELRFSFQTEQGAPLGDAASWVDDVRAWEVRSFSYLWDEHQLPWVAMAYSVSVTTVNEVLEDDPERFMRLAQYESALPSATVPLDDWKGRASRTKKQVLAAKCLDCMHNYRVSGADANNLALETGTISKLSRGWNNYTAVVGAWDTGVQSKNVGKQLRAQRADDVSASDAEKLWDAHQRLMCPKCDSGRVLIESPK